MVSADMIDRTRFPGLTAMVRKTPFAYLLDGDADYGMTVLLDHADGHFDLVRAEPAYTYRRKKFEERLTVIPLSRAAADALEDALLEHPAPAVATYDPSTHRAVRIGASGRPRTALTGEDVERIRALHADGWGVNRLATHFHVSNRRILALLK